jgi:preprotein translocase subunit Sec63
MGELSNPTLQNIQKKVALPKIVHLGLSVMVRIIAVIVLFVVLSLTVNRWYMKLIRQLQGISFGP